MVITTHFKYELWASQGAVVKNLPANTGNTRYLVLILGSQRSPGVGNGNLLQYSCLEWSLVGYSMGLQKCHTQLSD